MSGVPAEKRDFGLRVADLTRRFVSEWRQCEAKFPARPPVSEQEKRDNEAEILAVVLEIEQQIDRFPVGTSRQDEWRRTFRDSLRDIGRRRFGHPSDYSEVLLSDASFEITERFLEEARRFNSAFEIEDLFQALRNVWIMNTIQLFRGDPISYSQAIFAYSMLYPYTDNHLDDRTVDLLSKRRACDRLAQRLAGVALVPAEAREVDVFRLVGMIEDQFPRRDFGDVFESLLAIHRAQERSLQQHAHASSDEVDLLSISVEKGGTSVLADAYLVSGRLDPQEEEFHFGYGFLLQLLDDLQDIEADRAAGHDTLFSQTNLFLQRASHEVSKQPLDGVLNRLFGFMDRALGRAGCFPARGAAAARDLIPKNCTFMLLQAVAENPGSFSDDYLLRLEATSPVSFPFLRSQKRTLEKRLRRMRKKLGNKGGVEALFAFSSRQRPAARG